MIAVESPTVLEELPVRVALISDIHGNDVALRAALACIERVGVDLTVCLGDVATLGPRPRETLAMLRDRRCPCIQGNHDAFLLDPAAARAYTDAQVVLDAVDWCRAELTTDDLAFVRSFEPAMTLEPLAGATLALFHGSPRSHTEELLATTPPDVLEELLGRDRATVMAGGHTHLQMLRQHRGTIIVNPGSVGMPFLEHAAGRAPTLLAVVELAVVEISRAGTSVGLQRLPLDLHAALDEVRASKTPLRAMLLEQYANPSRPFSPHAPTG